MAGKKTSKNSKSNDNTIALNRQATHEYFIEEQFEAGLVLEGWEVKSLRDGRIQLKESYIEIRKGEPVRCTGNYCGVNQWCSQYQSYLKEKNV